MAKKYQETSQLQERIQADYPRLTASQKKIADYLLKSYTDAAFMTVSELGRQLGVDPGTVIRFAQRLGYAGYPELINDVQELVKEDLRALYEPRTEYREAQPAYVQALAGDWRNLDQAIAHTPQDAINEMLKVLGQATRVVILAQDMAVEPAQMLGRYLRILGIPAEAVLQTAPEFSFALRNLKSTDVVVGLGFARSNYDVATGLEVARHQGARTIGFSGTVACPVAQSAELALMCPSQSVTPIPSPVTMAASIFALFQALVAQQGESFENIMSRFHQNYLRMVEGRQGENEELREDALSQF
ncbi:MAG: MurR/RpiR family transcriptional regulator [Chloroflexi bacterium]|nr:MurR/RpiR family transcriptional regulator [Chloroflexota bacterium]